jgi:hypothetical protein
MHREEEGTFEYKRSVRRRKKKKKEIVLEIHKLMPVRNS